MPTSPQPVFVERVAAMAWGSPRLIAREVQKDAAKRTGPLHRRAGQALGVAVARQRIQQTIGGGVGRLAGVAVRRDRRKQPEKLQLVAVELLEGVIEVQRRPGLRAVDGVMSWRRAIAKKKGDAAAGLGLEDGVVLLRVLVHEQRVAEDTGRVHKTDQAIRMFRHERLDGLATRHVALLLGDFDTTL